MVEVLSFPCVLPPRAHMTRFLVTLSFYGSRIKIFNKRKKQAPEGKSDANASPFLLVVVLLLLWNRMVVGIWDILNWGCKHPGFKGSVQRDF